MGELNLTSPTAPTVDEVTNQINQHQTDCTIFQISKVKQNGTCLTKQLNLDGSRETAALIYDATIETLKLILSDFADGLADGVGQDVAFLIGTSVHAPCGLISSDNKAKGLLGITRTKENFQHSFLPSVMLLDIDFKQCPEHLHKGKEPIDILQSVLGDDFGYVVRGSTTSNIVNPNGKPLENKKGCHIYVLVECGFNIPNILDIIYKRLILAGCGFVFITTNGRNSIKTLVDKTVGGAERVIYEADPVLPEGYIQHRTTNYVAGGMLNVQPLAEEEEQQVEVLKEQLLAGAEFKCTRISEEWCVQNGITEQEAQEIERSGKLSLNFILTNNDGSTFTVADVWRDPHKYHKRSIRDPLEPEYGRDKAKIYVNREDDGSIKNIYINSMAHGENTKYRLSEPLDVMFDKTLEHDFINGGFKEKTIKSQPVSTSIFKPFKKIKNELLPVPDFPINALPESIRAWIVDEAERMSVPIDFIAVCVLTVLSSLLGKKHTIKPKKNDNWFVVPNLWGAMVGRPSSKKTPCLKVGARFINEFAEKEREVYQQRKEMYELHQEALKISKESRKKERKNTSDIETIKRELSSLDNQTEPEPILKQYIVNSCTIEKLQMILEENPNGLLVLHDELTGLLNRLSKDEHSEDRAFLLTAFTGDQSFTVDRVTRKTVHIKHCICSILGGIQPSKLVKLMEGVSKGMGANDDGLFQRFQLLVYPDFEKKIIIDRRSNEQALANAEAVFRKFNTLNSSPALNFSSKAQSLFDNFHQAIMDKASNETNVGMESHLGKYSSLMPSLSLILHIINSEDHSVSVIAAAAAIEICAYLEAHARRIYGLNDSVGYRAELLISKLSKLEDGFTVRDILQKEWGGLSDKKQVNETLKMLVERGYITQDNHKPTTGRPTIKYIINPEAVA